jgi:hypothetical protein
MAGVGWTGDDGTVGVQDRASLAKDHATITSL